MRICQLNCSLISLVLLLTSNEVMAADFEPIGLDQSTPVPLEELNQVRGVGGVVDVTNNDNLTAILTDNKATNNINGLNIIDHGSFTGASGIFSIIQNSGNNVIIQDSTIITISIIPN